MTSGPREAPPPSRPLITPGGPVGSFFAGLLVALLTALSPGARRRLAGFTGGLAYALGIRRRVTLDNLRHAYPELPEARRREIARGAYRNMARVVIDSLSTGALRDEQLAGAMEVVNGHLLEEAVAAGKGALLATAHFGSWELLGVLLARKGFPINAVVRPLKGALNARLVESRQAAGLKLILARGAILGTLRALQRGELVAVLIDQVVPAESGVFVPFFGREVSTTPTLALTALRTGAPTYVIMTVRDGDRLTLHVEGPFHTPRTKDRDADVRAHTATVTAVIERFIREHPEQWLWLHRRWKVPPPAPAETTATG